MRAKRLKIRNEFVNAQITDSITQVINESTENSTLKEEVITEKLAGEVLKIESPAKNAIVDLKKSKKK